MAKLVIFGLDDIAEVAEFYFRHDSPHEVVAFTVDGEYADRDSFLGRPVVPFEEVKTTFAPDAHSMFVSIGYNKINAVRTSKVAAAKDSGYALATYVSSRATTFPGFEAQENCFILEDNTIQPFAKVGRNVTLWSGNHIGHHCEIGDNCFISSHVVVSGGVKIGESCFIGVNATFRDHITVGKKSVIGANALVLEDLPDESVLAPRGTERASIPSSRLRKI